MVNFKILEIPFVSFFLDPKDITIVNFRLIGAKTAEEMSRNHSVHRRRHRRRGRTDGHGESNIPPTNYVGQEYKHPSSSDSNEKL